MSVPFEACQADDFAAAQTESRTVADECAAYAHHFILGARRALDFVMDRRSVAPHQLDEPVDRRVGDCAFPGDAPVAKHDDPRRDVDDFVQLVADEDESEPGPGPLAHIAAQLPGALEIERRSGFVEHDQTNVRSRGGAGDLDHLPLCY